MSSLSVDTASAMSALLADGSLGSQVGVSVLKKSMQVEQQQALQLLQSVAAQSAQVSQAAQAPSGTNNPPHLGNAIDTRA